MLLYLNLARVNKHRKTPLSATVPFFSLSHELVHADGPVIAVAVLIKVLQRRVHLLRTLGGQRLVALVQQQRSLGVLDGVVDLVL